MSLPLPSRGPAIVPAGLSQPELAEKAGCNKFTIAKLEQGRQEPAWPLVLALCDALSVSSEAFRPVPGETPVDESPRPRGRPKKAPAAPADASIAANAAPYGQQQNVADESKPGKRKGGRKKG